MSTAKINEALGIESIDSFLSSLNMDDGRVQELNSIDEQVRNDIRKIDGQIETYKKDGIEKIDVDDIQQSLGHIKELVDISKETIRYIYQQLIDSELVDSELVSSFSKLLEAVHVQIQEYIGLYKDRQNFFYKVKMECIKQRNKLEQMRLKHEMDLEKLEKQKTSDAVTVDNMQIAYSQEDLIKQLDGENRED